MSITTENGTVVSLVHDGHREPLVTLANPDKYPGEAIEAGRLAYSGQGFQPAPLSAYAMTPDVLRALADLIDHTKGPAS